MGLELGLIGLVILIADIYAIIRTVQSASSTGVKTLWVVVILIFPIAGLIAWLLFGPRG